MHTVSTNQILDILHFNNKPAYNIPVTCEICETCNKQNTFKQQFFILLAIFCHQSFVNHMLFTVYFDFVKKLEK